jgi:hypothetical protein
MIEHQRELYIAEYGTSNVYMLIFETGARGTFGSGSRRHFPNS